jgi:hypothetical protein
MLALQINRHHTGNLSDKEALRAHVEQMSPDKKREFVAAALQLLAARTLLDEAEDQAFYLEPVRNKRASLN